jgi:hypothetical protein
VVPSVGAGLGAVALVLTKTRYLSDTGLAAVNDPAMLLGSVAPKVNAVGCAVGVAQGAIVKQLTLASQPKFAIAFVALDRKRMVSEPVGSVEVIVPGEVVP